MLINTASTTPHSTPLPYVHTHTRTQVSRYQKGKTNVDFTEARDSGWQWHQLGHMQVCTSLQTDNHASTPPLSFFTGRMPFLPPNQQSHSTEGIRRTNKQTYSMAYRACVRAYVRHTGGGVVARLLVLSAAVSQSGEQRLLLAHLLMLVAPGCLTAVRLRLRRIIE